LWSFSFIFVIVTVGGSANRSFTQQRPRLDVQNRVWTLRAKDFFMYVGSMVTRRMGEDSS
jgi:hypothetical protein